MSIIANHKQRILCVEDHQGTSELITELLEAYAVTAARDLSDGMRLAQSERFDLYLCDYHLPEGTGLELCELIRTFDEETPVLLCSVLDSVTEQAVLAAGGQGFLKKGLGFSGKLEGALRRLLPAVAA